MALRMGMHRPRQSGPRKSGYTHSPDSVLTDIASEALRGVQSASSGVSPHSSLGDLQEAGANPSCESGVELDGVLEIWDSLWFGSMEALLEHEHVKRWRPVCRDPLESVAIPDALAVSSWRADILAPNAAPRLPEQQPADPVRHHSLLQQQQSAEVSARGSGSPAAARPPLPHALHPVPTSPFQNTAGRGGEWIGGDYPEEPSFKVDLADHLGKQQQLSGEASPLMQSREPSLECVLGTWAKRQYLLLPMPGRDGASPAGLGLGRPSSKPSAEAAAAAGGLSLGTSVAQPIPGAAVAAAEPQRSPAAVDRSSTDEEEAIAAAAWRWRMARRWQTEQQSALEGRESSAPDHLDEALQYITACGVNWQHLGRTGSTEPHLAGTAETNKLLGTLGSSFLGQELLASEDGFSCPRSRGTGGGLSREASFTVVGGMGQAGGGNALQEVTKINKKAQELVKAQGDIDKAVKQRWREVQTAQKGEMMWVGAHMDAVEVDDWGKFKFVLVRLRDRAGRQRQLVRGSNYASQAQLVERLHRQMMSLCAAHGLPAEPLEVVGGGVMEWRRDRDRHLTIQQGYTVPNGGMAAGEVMKLAQVLTKQHLPMGYKVSIDGGREI